MAQYDFTKLYVSLGVLTDEVNAVMSKDVSYMNGSSDGTLQIFFDEELTVEEQAVLQAAVDAHAGGNGQFYKENHHVQTLSSNKLTKEMWYETSNGDGTYSGKAREIEYTWSGISVTQETESVYCTNGALWVQTTYKYYMNSDGTISKELEV